MMEDRRAPVEVPGISGVIERYWKVFIGANVAFMAGVTMSGFIGLPAGVEAVSIKHDSDMDSLTVLIDARSTVTEERVTAMENYIERLDSWVCIQTKKELGLPVEECTNVGGGAGSIRGGGD